MRALALNNGKPPPKKKPLRKHAKAYGIVREIAREGKIKGCHAEPYPGEHRRSAALSDQQKRFHRGLPFFGIVFGLGELGDVDGRRGG
jgi:hypothetical protein